MDAYPGRIHPHNLQGAVNSTVYAKRASDEEMTLRRMILARLMLDDNLDEYCGCNRPRELFEFEGDDGSTMELSAREHE